MPSPRLSSVPLPHLDPGLPPRRHTTTKPPPEDEPPPEYPIAPRERRWELEVHEAVRNHEGWMVSMLAPTDNRAVVLAPPSLSAGAQAEAALSASHGRHGAVLPGARLEDVRLESRFDGLSLGDLAGSPLHRKPVAASPYSFGESAGAFATSSALAGGSSDAAYPPRIADELDKTQARRSPSLHRLVCIT